MAESRLKETILYPDTGILSGNIYAFGHNGFGHIETDGSLKLNRPKLFKLNVKCKEIRDIFATWRLTVVVTDGEVILLGSLDPSGENQSKTIAFASTMSKIVFIKDRNRLIGLCSDGKLILSEPDRLESCFTTTLEKASNIWLTHEGVLLKAPSYRLLSSLDCLGSVQFPLESGVVVRQVTCGHSHTAILTTEKLVYAYGVGTKGELGHGDLEGRESPVLLEALAGLQIVQVSSGGWHNLALTESGDVYSWGWNESGQLGLGATIQVISTPTLLPLQLQDELIEFKRVSCGSRHSCALTRQGNLYTWGWGAYGQLGHGDFTNQSSPKLLALNTEINYTIVDVVAGHWNTFLITKTA